jgi:hypothetical protein
MRLRASLLYIIPSEKIIKRNKMKFSPKYSLNRSFIASILILSSFSFLPTLEAFDCSSIYYKESEGVLNWLGNVTITVPVDTTGREWTITLIFDQIYTGIGVN